MREHTVLVVDDDKEIREAIGIYLRNEGLSVLEAEDGLAALELIVKGSVPLSGKFGLFSPTDAQKLSIRVFLAGRSSTFREASDFRSGEKVPETARIFHRRNLPGNRARPRCAKCPSSSANCRTRRFSWTFHPFRTEESFRNDSCSVICWLNNSRRMRAFS